ncbi:hypothetical protein EON65_17360 [archaeon]|nr:MAG: hypothetical protein EON65_17360 [archaeon]
MLARFATTSSLVFPSSVATQSVRRGLAAQISKTLKEGDSVPNVTFKARVRDNTMKVENPFKWKDVSSKELFAGKRVVLLALPGGTL